MDHCAAPHDATPRRRTATHGPLARRTRAVPTWIASVTVVLIGLTGCTTPAPVVSATPTRASSPDGPSTPTVTNAATPAAPAPHPPAGIDKVLTIVLENHGVAAVNRDMPRLVALAHQFGRTSNDRAVTHPSLPNYLALAGGSTFGVHDDAGPSAHPLTGPSVFDLAISHGRSARTYAEAMPTSCALESHGRYAVKHNPWTYFSDPESRRSCAVDDVPMGTTTSGRLASDSASGSLPTVGLAIPDLCNDAHDCGLATADAWVADWVSRIQQGADWASGHLAVVVTFDEAETGSDNTVMTVVIAPTLHGAVVDQPLTHLSWTRWMSDLVDSPAPRDAADAASLGTAFGL